MKVRPIMMNIKIIKADKIVTKAADVVTCCTTNGISMAIEPIDNIKTSDG